MDNREETKVCQNCKASFIIDATDFLFYEKIKVPSPTLCPDCRLQLRMLFRNERSFYKRTCDLCRKGIISSYAPEYTSPVYCQKCWWSDGWDPFYYGRDYDFSKPFFEQYKGILYSVPVISLMNDDGIASVNCEYTYDWGFSKNSYLSVCGWHDENTAYVYGVKHSKEIFDCFDVAYSELMYESLNSDRCYGSAYCIYCFDSRDCMFGMDLRNCSDCIMCVGLRNKQYCILNQQYSREEYFKKKDEMQLGSRKMVEKHIDELRKFSLKYPRRFAMILKSVNSTGDNLINAKNSRDSFFVPDLENCRYIVQGDGAKDTYDCNNTGHPEHTYNSVTPDNSYGSIGTIFCWKCNMVEYSNNCHASDNLFGCSGLKKASYAILNKKYSKEEYMEMRKKIIVQMREAGEWGEFLPPELSPYAYNESAAQEWFTLAREVALKRGFRWRIFEKKVYSISLPSERIPDTITEVGENILSETIGCLHGGNCNELCTTAFRIIPQELEFYRARNIPLPALCPNCRHYRRLKLRNPPKLWRRKCNCEGQFSGNGGYKNKAVHLHGSNSCPNESETSYSPERPEIIYCEACYNNETV